MAAMSLFLDRIDVDPQAVIDSDAPTEVFEEIGAQIASGCSASGVDAAISALVVFTAGEEPKRTEYAQIFIDTFLSSTCDESYWEPSSLAKAVCALR
jgi:hypothetical protein